jgi:hypothetical protein
MRVGNEVGFLSWNHQYPSYLCTTTVEGLVNPIYLSKNFDFKQFKPKFVNIFEVNDSQLTLVFSNYIEKPIFWCVLWWLWQIIKWIFHWDQGNIRPNWAHYPIYSENYARWANFWHKKWWIYRRCSNHWVCIRIHT